MTRKLPKKLSRRHLVTLKDAARSYQGRALGTHIQNNGMAAFDLQEWGLVRIGEGTMFCYATDKGLAVLHAGGVTE